MSSVRIRCADRAAKSAAGARSAVVRRRSYRCSWSCSEEMPPAGITQKVSFDGLRKMIRLVSVPCCVAHAPVLCLLIGHHPVRSRARHNALCSAVSNSVTHAPRSQILSAQRGWTPLHCAAEHGHVEVVEALLEKGANIEARNWVRRSRAVRFPLTYIVTTAMRPRRGCCHGAE